MPPPTTMRRFPILMALLFLAFASFSTAALFGGKKNDAASAEADATAITSTDDALANAKKLVNDLNDAATGTVTSYQPGREKAPTTCNEIMAKSLVVANEEKAALTAEKDAVVKAATLLSEKNDELSSQLKVARAEITALEKAAAEATSECDAKFEAQKAEMMVEKSELEQKIEDMTREINQKLEDQAKFHFEELDAQKKVALDDMTEMEQKITNLKAAHDAEMNNVWDGAALMKETVQKTMDEAKANNEARLKEVMEVAAQIKQQAEEKILEGEEQSKLNMGKLRNSTAATVAKIEKETAEKLAASENEVAIKLENAKQEALSAKADAQDKIMKSQQAADEKVSSINAKAEQQHSAIMEDAQKRINDAKAQAQHEVDRKHQEMVDREDVLQLEMSNLKGAHAAKVKDVETLMDQKVQEVHASMEAAITKATTELNAEKKKYNDLEKKLEKEETEAQDLQTNLRSTLKLQKSESFKLEKEVSFWKETHEAQGYCNMTLVKEDSQRLISNALDGAGRGLDSQRQLVQRTLSEGAQLVQRTLSEGALFVEKEIIPVIERSYSEACDKAMILYDEHMAKFVEDNVLPVYNENIRPTYEEHISPVVKIVGKEAQIAKQKVSEGVDKAQSKASVLVSKSSNDVLEVLEEDGYDRMLPSWLYEILNNAATDDGGKEAVGSLTRGLLIITVILCRSLIYRIIGLVFSLVWFFCPLRLFVGGRKPKRDAEYDAKKVSTSSIKKVAKPAKGNAVVY